MAWIDNLQPASFRGVPFHVESDTLSAGRRVQTHEYPGRDKPYTEDIGRASRKGSIEAFLIGNDYMAARDRLLAALEQGGPGELVHPWYGRMSISVDDGCRVRHGARDGRYCAITISFVEAGELAYPTAAASTAAQSLQAADALKTSALDDFVSKFSIDNLPDFGVLGAVNSATAMLGKLDNALFHMEGVLKTPARLMGDLNTLLLAPQSYAQKLFGIFASGAGYLSLGDKRDTSRAQTTAASAKQFPAPQSSGSLTPTRQRMQDNEAALAALTRRAVIVQAAGMAAVSGIPVHDDGVALRTGLTAVIEEEGYTASDAVYTALCDLRARVHADITEKLRNSARLRTFTPREVVPALVLAHDLYEDPERGDEIVARNNIRHPGFVPVQPLMVLTA